VIVFGGRLRLTNLAIEFDVQFVELTFSLSKQFEMLWLAARRAQDFKSGSAGRSDADVDSNSLEVIVARLRRKIGHEMIETVRGRGYRLTPGNP